MIKHDQRIEPGLQEISLCPILLSLGIELISDLQECCKLRQSRSGGMADALDSKSSNRKVVGVQVPAPVLKTIVFHYAATGNGSALTMQTSDNQIALYCPLSSRRIR